jgi:sortase (surface protein transpeptidase)
VIAESVPVITDPAPEITDPVPEVEESAPEIIESAPVIVESAPVILDEPTSTVPPPQIAPIAPSIPKRLIIPTAKVNARVVGVTVTDEGNLDVPPNLVEVGWYSPGTIPGDVGSAVLDGHVDNGAFTDGVFKHLRDVKLGDEISVVGENGQTIKFVVTESNVYQTDSFPAESVFHKYDGATIKIITCHGKWMPARKTYDQRLVVTATRI